MKILQKESSYVGKLIKEKLDVKDFPKNSEFHKNINELYIGHPVWDLDDWVADLKNYNSRYNNES